MRRRKKNKSTPDVPPHKFAISPLLHCWNSFKKFEWSQVTDLVSVHISSQSIWITCAPCSRNTWLYWTCQCTPGPPNPSQWPSWICLSLCWSWIPWFGTPIWSYLGTELSWIGMVLVIPCNSSLPFWSIALLQRYSMGFFLPSPHNPKTEVNLTRSPVYATYMYLYKYVGTFIYCI